MVGYAAQAAITNSTFLNHKNLQTPPVLTISQ